MTPLVGLFKKKGKNLKDKEPYIVCTEFIDRDGFMFASCPGIGNVTSLSLNIKGPIIKRTKWSDGCSFDEIWGSSTYGVPIKDKEEEYLSPYLEYNRLR
jgi:hypothetical protein